MVFIRCPFFVRKFECGSNIHPQFRFFKWGVPAFPGGPKKGIRLRQRLPPSQDLLRRTSRRDKRTRFPDIGEDVPVSLHYDATRKTILRLLSEELLRERASSAKAAAERESGNCRAGQGLLGPIDLILGETGAVSTWVMFWHIVRCLHVQPKGGSDASMVI